MKRFIIVAVAALVAFGGTLRADELQDSVIACQQHRSKVRPYNPPFEGEWQQHCPAIIDQHTKTLAEQEKQARTAKEAADLAAAKALAERLKH